jgi:glucose-1-phosphate thymidylyltransferase
MIEWGEAGRIQSLEEKPQIPRSSDIVTGLYLYDSEVVSYAKQLKPSSRGELEITDINRKYLAQQQLQVFPLSQEMRWFDVGTPDSLLEASLFIASQEKLQGRKIACLEEIALRQKFLKEERATQALLKSLPEGSWKQYVQEVWNHLEQEGRL